MHIMYLRRMWCGWQVEAGGAEIFLFRKKYSWDKWQREKKKKKKIRSYKWSVEVAVLEAANEKWNRFGFARSVERPCTVHEHEWATAPTIEANIYIYVHTKILHIWHENFYGLHDTETEWYTYIETDKRINSFERRESAPKIVEAKKCTAYKLDIKWIRPQHTYLFIYFHSFSPTFRLRCRLPFLSRSLHVIIIICTLCGGNITLSYVSSTSRI